MVGDAYRGDFDNQAKEFSALHAKNKGGFEKLPQDLDALKNEAVQASVDAAIPAAPIVQEKLQQTHTVFAKRLEILKKCVDAEEDICKRFDSAVDLYKDVKFDEKALQGMQLIKEKLFKDNEKEIKGFNEKFPVLKANSDEFRTLKERATLLSGEIETSLAFFLGVATAGKPYSDARVLNNQYAASSEAFGKLPKTAEDYTKEIDARYYELKSGKAKYEEEGQKKAEFQGKIDGLRNKVKEVEVLLGGVQAELKAVVSPELSKVKAVFDFHKQQIEELKKAETTLKALKEKLVVVMPTLEDSFGWYVQLVDSKGVITTRQMLTNKIWGATVPAAPVSATPETVVPEKK